MAVARFVLGFPDDNDSSSTSVLAACSVMRVENKLLLSYPASFIFLVALACLRDSRPRPQLTSTSASGVAGGANEAVLLLFLFLRSFSASFY